MSLQEFDITHSFGIEIDRAVENIRRKLERLSWISEAYGIAISKIDKTTQRRNPFVYEGGATKNYVSAKPDDSKMGTCFFMVGDRHNGGDRYGGGDQAILKYNVGIIFSVNLSLIDAERSNTELFTQELIRDVRNVLRKECIGLGFIVQATKETRSFKEIYREFLPFEDKDDTHLDEGRNFDLAPMQQFRFNLEITLFEECGDTLLDPPAACLDATAVVKDQDGNIIITELIPSGTSEDIVVNIEAYRKPVVNTEDTPLADQTPLGPDYTVDDTVIPYAENTIYNTTGRTEDGLGVVNHEDSRLTLVSGKPLEYNIDGERIGEELDCRVQATIGTDAGILVASVHRMMLGNVVFRHTQLLDIPLLNSLAETIGLITPTLLSIEVDEGSTGRFQYRTITLQPHTIADTNLLDTAAAVIGTIVAGQDATAPNGTVNYVVKFDDDEPIESDAVIVRSGGTESLEVIVTKPGPGADGTARLTDSALALLFDTAIPPGSTVSIQAPDGVLTITLKDTAGTAIGSPISPLNVLAGSTPTLDVEAPDATVNIQKQDSTPANIGLVIPVTAKSDETLAVNVPVSDSTVNIQRKDTAGGLIGAIIPVAVKAEGTIAQDVESPDASAVLKDTAGATLSTTAIKSNDSADITAPDATAVLKNTLGNIQSTTLIKSASSLDLIANDASVDLVDTAGNPLSTTSVPSNRSTQVTAPNGILRDSTPTDVNVKSNEVLVIADTDVTNSDNATVLYSEPKFNNVSLPSIRLTVGATDHDYETSAFTYSGGVLSKTIDDIAGAPVKSGIKYQDWAFYVNRPSYFDGDIRWQIDRGDFDRLPEPSNPTHEARLADPSNPFVLADNNEFGNTSRWTNSIGTQVYTEFDWNKDHLLGVEFQCRGVATGNRLNPAERRDFCIANGGFVMPMFLLLRMHAGYWTYRWTQNNPAIVAILGNGNLIIPTTDPNQNTAGGTPTTYYMGSSANYQQSYYVTNESIASSSKRAWIWCRRFNTL